MKDVIEVKRALISVSDKTGIIEFASRLDSLGVEILSTGGTFKQLSEKGIPVKAVESYTGFPEMMDGRIKTLHPRIHGALLAIRDNETHMREARENGIVPIDLVVVNLYPFEKTIAKKDVAIEEAVENIDIGGPTMLRSSAKNHTYVTVVVDPADYAAIMRELEEKKGISLETRKRCAIKVFRHTSHYDACISNYLAGAYTGEKLLALNYGGGTEMRYGENPHQAAVFYKKAGVTEPCIANAEQLHGKELSFNNIVDADAALEAVRELIAVPAAAVIKHTNPCGYATGETMAGALEAAWSGDIVSAFGSVIAVTRPVDIKTAEVLKGRFVEILIAPDFEPDALAFLREKSSSIRLLKIGDITGAPVEKQVYKHVTGGILAQDRDLLDFEKWECVTAAKFPSGKDALARFAWKACKHVKSNAIILAQEYKPGCFRIAGMGAGQPNRVDSLRKLAVTKAQENVKRDREAAAQALPADGVYAGEFSQMVLASDAFFPFADNIDEAHKAGIRFIVEPGGSKKDSDVVAACDRYGIAMIFTGTRHFRH